MNLNGHYDPDAARPAYSALPAGWYVGMITESEEKQTRAGTGSYLELTIEIVGGQYAGRRVWARLNLNNPNQTAVDIARRDLASIVQALGLQSVQNSAELHNKPLAVRVAQREYQGEMRNEVKGFKPAKNMGVSALAGTDGSGAAPAAAPTAAPSPAPARTARPWAR